jgi:hypothetical protein
VCIIFRGGWIDNIIVKKNHKSAEELEVWLTSLNYFEELTGIALGPEINSLLKTGGKRKVEAWSESKGKKVMLLSTRNRCQAKIIINGVKQFL